MKYIPQKSYANRKVFVERAIFGLLYIGTHRSRCDNRVKVYHLLILGGVICCVIFIGKWNKELSLTIFQEYPQWATNIAQQSYNTLKSLGNIA